MKLLNKLLVIGAVSLAALGIGRASVVGQPAPNFTLTDINGQKHSLADFKGKTVVLEWVNQECPFVVKHYDKSGNMPKVQKQAAADGVIWLQINSGKPGAQGDYEPAKVAAWQKANNVVATAYFRDQDGKVGKLYDARTTPHMYIIDAKGTLVYAGGIDSKASAKVDDIASATNYVQVALAEIKAGKPVTTATAKPYGCGVKYAD